MRVIVEGHDSKVLDVGLGDGLLLPLCQNERAAAFAALTDALALLAGFTKPDAREDGTSPRSTPSSQSACHRTPGVVVPLRSP